MKNVLLLIHDDTGQEARLQAALDATRALGGHLTCVHATEFGPVIGDAYGMSEGVILLDVAREQEATHRAAIEKKLAVEDVSFGWVEVTEALEPAIEEASALADLIVINGDLAGLFQTTKRSLVERLVVKSRRPLLVVSNAKGFRAADPALIAWDGSEPASEALRAAVPLLKLSSSVTLYEVDAGNGGESIEAAAEYLSRHGVHAEVVREKVADKDFIEPVLLRMFESGRFAWAVMGGFSKSRIRESLFGGTTKRLLEESPIPLFIAH
jgi:nucleotide-binding universal stress UspA family protein